MAESFAEKIKTLNFGNPQKRGPKRTVTVTGTAKALTTEHWNDRVDVEIRPGTIRGSGPKVGVS